MSPAAAPRPSAAPGWPPAHLLLGPEEGEKAAFIEKLKAALAAQHGEQPEITRFYAGEARMNEVVQCLSNKTLFSRHRLVIVANAEEVKRAEDVAAIVQYMSSPAPDATLLLVSAGLTADIDRKITGDVRSKHPGAIPFDSQKIFWEMFDNQKQGWVTGFFRQKKITIDPEAAEYILDMVENNTRDMRVECDRLAQFFGPGAVIGLDSVEQYIYHSKEENVFTLFDKICARELAGAEEVLARILLSRESEATQLAGGLLLQFRRLASLTRMLADNYETAEAFPKLRIFSKRNQKTYIEGTKKFRAAEIETIIQLLAEFDVRFRSLKSDLHELLLHLMVYYIVVRAGQGAWQQSL